MGIARAWGGTAVGAIEYPASARLPSARARIDGWNWSTVGRWVVEVSALAALYYASGKLGLVFRFSGPVAAIIWLPAGVGIAYLALRGLRCWPGVLIGDLVLNSYATVGLVGGVAQTVGNVLEVVVGAWLIRRWMRDKPILDTVTGVGVTLGAIALGTGISATIGPLSLVATNKLGWHELPTVARTWWLGDATGALVTVPFALAWFGHATAYGYRNRRLVAPLAAMVAVLSLLALDPSPAHAYLAFPALVVCAILLGARGGTLAVAVTAALTVLVTTHNDGPFAFDSITRSVLNAQLYIAVATVATLVVAALVAEKEAMTVRLEAALAESVRAGFVERHRLERNLHDGAQQRLIALRMKLGLLAPYVSGERGREVLDDADHEVRVAMDDLRAIAHGTFPPVLLERGLAGAVAELAARSSVPVVMLEAPELGADVASEAAAYYIVSEALANVSKHAGASHVWVAVTTSREEISVAVIDDGNGAAREQPGAGLAGLHERADKLGGSFNLVSIPGFGTCLAATIPVGAASSNGSAPDGAA